VGVEGKGTYFGDVWVSCTRSRLSGVEVSSVWLGSINLPLGIFTWVFREFCESAGLGLQASRNCPKVEWRRWSVSSIAKFVAGGMWRVLPLAASCGAGIRRTCRDPTQFQL
jgi:hypothetical protein